MDKIKAELTAITDKYKKDFEAEINGEKVFKNILDVTKLIDEYNPKLNNELLITASSQLKYIDEKDRIILEEFIRHLELDFLKFASAFL